MGRYQIWGKTGLIRICLCLMPVWAAALPALGSGKIEMLPAAPGLAGFGKSGSLSVSGLGRNGFLSVVASDKADMLPRAPGLNKMDTLPAYFIDGYHGGIYGHLPNWQTRFMVEKLRQYPDWKINLELEPESWDSIALQDPVAFRDFQQLAADQSSNGRVEYVNPAYGQSYMYTISGESVIRQFYYGMKKLRRYFPGMVFSTYSSEEPCFTSALPQILRSYGFRYASLKNPNTCWGGYTRAYGGELVNWIGPDGSSLLTVPRYAVEALKPRSIWETMAASNSTGYVLNAFRYGIRHPVGMCLQDAGWAAGPWLGGSVGRRVTAGTDETTGRSAVAGGKEKVDGSQTDRQVLDSNTTYVPTIYETWRGYMANRTNQKADRDWKLSQEDVLVSLMWGAQVLQRIAREVRISENTIIRAEKLAALARIYAGRAWPGESLEEAWRTLLLSQHHDCWIVPYNGKPGDSWADKVVRWTGNTNERSGDILDGSMAALSANTGTTGDVQLIRVFNTLGVGREEAVSVGLPAGWGAATVLGHNGRDIVSQLTEGGTILFRARVPSLGYSTYRLRKGVGQAGPGEGDPISGKDDSISCRRSNGAKAIRLASGLYALETDLYRILLDPAKGGVIKSWIAKRLAGKEFVAAGVGRGFNELRGNFYKAGGFRSSMESPAEIRILENGPVRVKVEIRGQIAGSPFTQVIDLEQGQPRVDVHLRIDWKENTAIGEYYDEPKNEEVRKAYYDDRYKLLANFPLQLAAQKVYKNAPFDVTESHLDHTWFNRWDSIKNNVMLNWVDVEDGTGRYGMALFCDHTTSYVHGENFPLALTVQYSGNGIFYRDYTLAGATEVSYAWMPHAGKWDRAGIWTEGTKWNEPLLVRVGGTGVIGSKAVGISEKASSLLQLSGTGIEVSSITCDGDDLIVRLFNAEGDAVSRRVYLGFATDRVEEITLDGAGIKELPIRRDSLKKLWVDLSMPRFGIRTIRFIQARKEISFKNK